MSCIIVHFFILRFVRVIYRIWLYNQHCTNSNWMYLFNALFFPASLSLTLLPPPSVSFPEFQSNNWHDKTHPQNIRRNWSWKQCWCVQILDLCQVTYVVISRVSIQEARIFHLIIIAIIMKMADWLLLHLIFTIIYD